MFCNKDDFRAYSRETDSKFSLDILENKCLDHTNTRARRDLSTFCLSDSFHEKKKKTEQNIAFFHEYRVGKGIIP